jgi:hypothetical protein
MPNYDRFSEGNADRREPLQQELDPFGSIQFVLSLLEISAIKWSV